jgi:hypothetical protein
MTTTMEFKLPHDPLTALDPTQEPTPASIHLLTKELYANSRKIYKDGSHHGHLGLVMPVAAYTALTGAAYVSPDYPDIPDYTNTQDPGTMAMWKALYEQQIIDHNVDRALGNHLLTLITAAVPSDYTVALEDPLHGLADVTPLQILEHLTTAYGTIESEDLEANLASLGAPWDPTTPITVVFNNATARTQYAIIGGDPITEATLVRTLTKVFALSGVFELEMKTWKAKPRADQSYANLKTYFTNANKQRLLSDKTLQHTLAANAATVPPPTANGGDPPSTIEYSYCHTHGYCKNLQHTSITCTFPGPNHNKNATATNKLGGVTTTFTPQPRQKDNKKRSTDRNGKQSKEEKAAAKTAAANAAAAAQAAMIGEAVKAAMAAIMATSQSVSM